MNGKLYILCNGRHEPDLYALDQPVKNPEPIFGNIENPLDFDKMEEIVDAKIPADCDVVEVIVTGLTAAMLAVVSVCQKRNIALWAWHYTRENKTLSDGRVVAYYAGQPVMGWHRCPYCGTWTLGGICSECEEEG